MRKMKMVFVITILCLCACSSSPVTPTSITAPTIIAGTNAKEWKMVVLGDSDMWDAYKIYSKYYEEDLGISIVVEDLISMSSPSTQFLEKVKTLDKWRSAITNANIVAFNVPLVFPMMGGACFNSSLSIEKDGCFSETADVYAENVRGVIREIKTLVGEKGAMIRLQNTLVPIDWWRSSPSLKDRADQCFQCFVEFYQAQKRVADEENIPVVDVLRKFHGVNLDENPADKGWMGSDGIHVNETGAKEVADLYRAAEYSYWRP